MPDETKDKIIEFIEEEASRMKFGKLFIEVLVHKGKCTNVQLETKRSVNLENNN